MSRLTEKRKQALNNIYHNTKSYTNGEDNYNYLTISDALDKLGQLEDVVGTGRTYFFVKGKLIAENKVSISKCYVIETDFDKKEIDFQGHLKTFKFNEYGKTWALTKEELE